MILWLNRIGIILNFLAGFLLAPELIGVERISKAESSLEIYIQKLHIRILSTLEKFPYKTKEGKDEFLAVLVFGSVLVGIFFILYWISLRYGTIQAVATFFGALVLMSLTLTFFFRNLFTKNKGKSTIQNSIAIIRGIFMMPVAFGAGSFFILQGLLKLIIQIPVYGILVLVKPILGLVSKKLVGDDRLRSMLVTFGILIYIVGNLLQLWATF